MPIQSMFPPVPPLPPSNIHDFLFRQPGQEFGRDDYTLHVDSVTGRKRSSREFIERVYDGATALGAAVSDGGLGLNADHGEMVGILSENCMDYIVLAHSVLVLTVPFAPISSYSTPIELAHALRQSKVTRVFVSPRLLSVTLKVINEVNFPQDRIYILEGDVKGRKSFGDMIKSVRRRGIPRVPVRLAGKDTLAYLVFSSGTSGLPKGVMISHGNLCFAIAQYMVYAQTLENYGYVPPPPNTPDGIPTGLAFLPLHHSYGLHFFAFRALLAPTKMILMPKWNTDVAANLIPRHKITILFLIPSVVQSFLDAVRRLKVDLSSVQSIACGAAHLPAKSADELERIKPGNVDLINGYGLSESTIAAATRARPELFRDRVKSIESPDKYRAVGFLLPSMQARIVKEDGTDAAFNEPGELWLSGDNVALGYWQNEKATKETFLEEKWLRTGDRLSVNEDGVFFFDDRVKDTLKVSGAQVSPKEIEEVLLSHPDKLISDCTVAGVSGGRTSDEKVPRAWVVLSSEGSKRGKRAVIQALDT